MTKKNCRYKSPPKILVSFLFRFSSSCSIVFNTCFKFCILFWSLSGSAPFAREIFANFISPSWCCNEAFNLFNFECWWVLAETLPLNCSSLLSTLRFVKFKLFACEFVSTTSSLSSLICKDSFSGVFSSKMLVSYRSPFNNFKYMHTCIPHLYGLHTRYKRAIGALLNHLINSRMG